MIGDLCIKLAIIHIIDLGEKMKKSQKIKCNVSNCKYNNTKNCECNLDEIKVSCDCDACDCEHKDATVCESFDSKENE